MTIVERVARAIACEENHMEEFWRQHYLSVARAAIGAMREPSEAMVDCDGAVDILFRIAEEAENHGEFLGGYEWAQDATSAVWRAMIDAALRETGDG